MLPLVLKGLLFAATSVVNVSPVRKLVEVLKMGWRQRIRRVVSGRCPHCGEELEYVLVEAQVLHWELWEGVPEDDTIVLENPITSERVETVSRLYSCPYCRETLTSEEVREIFGVDNP